jgi:hypothetical protein
MHFEFLVEDRSGRAMLGRLVPKIISEKNTFTIHAYKGIGRIPKNLNPKSDPDKRILLDQLPRLLGGYGKAFYSYPADYRAAVIVVCDLDDRDLKDFTEELVEVQRKVTPSPKTEFCIAIEEGEAWFLGDITAIKKAYPKAKPAVLTAYKNDSICNTWETLADAVYPGGSGALNAQGYQLVGKEKTRWAEDITPHMDVAVNKSPSFGRFREALENFENTDD